MNLPPTDPLPSFPERRDPRREITAHPCSPTEISCAPCAHQAPHGNCANDFLVLGAFLALATDQVDP